MIRCVTEVCKMPLRCDAVLKLFKSMTSFSISDQLYDTFQTKESFTMHAVNTVIKYSSFMLEIRIRWETFWYATVIESVTWKFEFILIA